MAPDDNTAQVLQADMDLAASAAWEHVRSPTPATAHNARAVCASLGIDYLALVVACQRRNEQLVEGPVDVGLAMLEVARALSRSADRVRG